MNTLEQELVTLSAFGRFAETVKRHERWGLALGISLQLAVLLFMTAKGTLILIRGEVYYVRVQPVDPRDLMRGDYVILSYEFSRQLPPNWDGMGRQGQPIYVTLVREADGKHWRGAHSSFEKPHKGPFLKGKMNQRGQLEFGIEQFFVQESKGLEYENAVRSRLLSSEISITPEGDAAMRGLHILAN
ncbi:MAG: hypothetical protein EXS16_12670 [Gemmataceae bacterium]|nr:hypothetical protein [Gemmataceae bacterium]